MGSDHTIVKWYVEVYGPIEMEVPPYKDPKPSPKKGHSLDEVKIRLEKLEQLLTTLIQQLPSEEADQDIAATIAGVEEVDTPGFTTVRQITYKDQVIDVPYFLRDAFLLSQRFEKSERFLVRLGAVEQARIMSELPADLEGLHKLVKRYNESNDRNFFEELKIYIEEEKQRRQLTMEHPGELFFFYRADYIVVTEQLSQVPLTRKQFVGMPSLIRQLHADDIHTVGQLPKEPVISAKYDNVGWDGGETVCIVEGEAGG